MLRFLFFIQTVPSSANAESGDSLKSLAQIVAILGGAAAIVVILLTRTWPWLKAKLDRRSIQERIGAEAFTPANIEQSLRYYVTPLCQNIDPAGGEEPRAHYGVKQNLFEALDEALSRQTEYRYLILLADSGMGKTSALLSYYARHIRVLRSKGRFQLAVIPLGIPNADELIGAVANKQDTVLFLDALDEDTLANVDHVVRVRDLLALTRDFSRVVITCRSQFFPKDEEIPRETGILKVGARKAGEGAEYIFHKLYLSPFTDEQVKRYLHRRYPLWRRGRRKSAFAMIKQIPSLVVRPMLLAHIDDLIRREREITSSWDLYSEMVEAWLTREEGLVNKENLRQFSELLAVDLYVNRQARGGEFVPLDDLAGLAKGWGIPIDEWRLGSRSLLNRDAQGNYKFAHRSIMEYLCVKRFVQGDPALNDTEWTDQMNLFVRELFDDIRLARQTSSHFINTSEWNSNQCLALVSAVWYAEESVPRLQYRSPEEVLVFLKTMMLADASNSDFAEIGAKGFRALMTLTSVCMNLKELEEAEECGRQALQVAQATADKIKVFDILGVIYAEMGRKRLAVERYESALNLMEEIGAPDTARVKAQIETWRREIETTFEFKAITVDVSGQVTQWRNGKARGFIEELAPGVVLDMVEIPGGVFTMGAPAEEESSSSDERPQHEVTISPFNIGKSAVTQAQWKEVAGLAAIDRELEADPSRFKGDARPVENVSWEDAVEFCARLSRKIGQVYRLPTEAEWEYACRAGTTTPFAFGETITPQIVNSDGNYPYGKARKGVFRRVAVAVGSLGVANEFGLYDMHGNVWEWCQDWYGPYKSGAAIDPLGPSKGQYRVLRGGSWIVNAGDCRSACRLYFEPGCRNLNVGFRVVVGSSTLRR